MDKIPVIGPFLAIAFNIVFWVWLVCAILAVAIFLPTELARLRRHKIRVEWPGLIGTALLIALIGPYYLYVALRVFVLDRRKGG